ncbi:hypothetical protein DFA_03954 [Cavenderia fasciculata]|uniref:Pleckstrin domain-containing protein n=1 Tax=Cavenderia fasciculata TaxID=261658 RepID=F4Q0V9_CACFS|nr:uncharacterized protein DFA_03954 [Cavenderia fasciculata]EGG18460.1 hypothetical protein DFA_03954 [Cavenderia fasciculata]|eukprot:XP_004366364.1 hypothetical protein DFA_03954 [Cavenderia fasciculata]
MALRHTRPNYKLVDISDDEYSDSSSSSSSSDHDDDHSGDDVDIQDQHEGLIQNFQERANIMHRDAYNQTMATIGGGVGGQDAILKMIDEKSKKKMMDIKTISEKQSDLDKKISTLLTIIEDPWQDLEVDQSAPACIIEGELYKKRFNSTWKKYYFALNGNSLYYYKSRNTKKPKGIISISFVSPPIGLTEKNIVDMKTPDVSNYFMQVFSPKRIDSICATNNEDFERWCNILQKLVKDKLEVNDYTCRFNAFQEVYPLFEKKSEMELNRLLLLLAEIDNKSTHIIGKAKKEKTGNLMMMEDDEITGQITWKQYYFALLDKCLYYYKSSKLPPQGVITLKYTDVQICDTTISNDLQYSFKLTTPLSVFILKAKHQVSLEDWVDTLNQSKHGKPSNNILGHIPLPFNLQNQESSSLVGSMNINNNNHNNNNHSDTNSHNNSPTPGLVMSGLGKKFIPTLVYTPVNASPGSKPKKVKLSLGSNTIGRSESCSVVIDDKQVSRMHCKVEVTDTTCTILDIGSGHGTKINRRTIDRHNLEIGDTIKIGKTKLKFNGN